MTLEFWISSFLLVSSCLLYLFYRYIKTTYNYFRRKNIPYLKPTLWWGYKEMFTKPCILVGRDLYKMFPRERFFGIFQGLVPVLVVSDPTLAHRVLVTDFVHFSDRGVPEISQERLEGLILPLCKHSIWRVLRPKMTPTFSEKAIKLLFDHFLFSGENLLKTLENNVDRTVDVKVLSAEYTTEVIARTVFGIDYSKNDSTTMEFLKHASKGFGRGLHAKIHLLLYLIQKLLSLLKVGSLSHKTEQYYINLIKSAREYRKQNIVKRNDYLQVLTDLQKGAETQEIITDRLLAAQAALLSFAGRDTASGPMIFSMYHIAKDPIIQNKIIQEIDKALNEHGGWTYEAIKSLKYMDQVIQESLRMYPELPIVTRKCTMDYRIPGTDIVLEKGTFVGVPVTGLHMDPEYYQAPDLFNPDRFAGNNYKPNLTYLPFGNGPRLCVGYKFGVLEIKIGLSKILSQYSIKLNSRTEDPLTFDPAVYIIPKPKGGIWIDLKKRNKTT